eukprot:352941-Chlamydomonas_euryale.AAC.3
MIEWNVLRPAGAGGPRCSLCGWVLTRLLNSQNARGAVRRGLHVCQVICCRSVVGAPREGSARRAAPGHHNAMAGVEDADIDVRAIVDGIFGRMVAEAVSVVEQHKSDAPLPPLEPLQAVGSETSDTAVVARITEQIFSIVRAAFDGVEQEHAAGLAAPDSAAGLAAQGTEAEAHAEKAEEDPVARLARLACAAVVALHDGPAQASIRPPCGIPRKYTRCDGAAAAVAAARASQPHACPHARAACTRSSFCLCVPLGSDLAGTLTPAACSCMSQGPAVGSAPRPRHRCAASGCVPGGAGAQVGVDAPCGAGAV